MADTKISALTAAASALTTQEFAANEAGASKKVTGAQLKTLINDVATDVLWDAAGDVVVGTGANTAAKLAITVPAANILNVLGVVNGETTATWKSVHDGTAPVTQAFGDAAAAGTSLLAAHRDHVHGMPAGKPLTTVHLTGDETGKTDSTLANTSLSLAVLGAGTPHYYAFKFLVVYRSTVSTVGLRIGLTTPTFTVFSASAIVQGLGADGKGAAWDGLINTSGDATVSTATAIINDDAIAIIEGVILPSADGNIVVQYAAEITGATVTVRKASVGMLWDLGT